MITFEVDDIYRGDDSVTVAGRCINGPIAIGDVFLYQYKPIFEKHDDDCKSVVFSEVERVQLTVVGIQCLRMDVPEIVDGYSGAIQLTGDSVVDLKAGKLITSAIGGQC
ncbi:hypothetical protein [Hahella sp. HN01]|nr:hypothetical protein [Hahella sp. HN01]